jgi:hypothetical protein
MGISIYQIHYSTIKSSLDMTINVLDHIFNKLFTDFVEIGTEECQQQSSLFVFISLAENFMHTSAGFT